MKPLNSEHSRVLKHLSVIDRCPLLGGNLKKIATLETKCFVRYSWHDRYLGYPLFGGFIVEWILFSDSLASYKLIWNFLRPE